jgi:hypothetical protein
MPLWRRVQRIAMKKRSDPARILDAARLLPILGVFLLMPPIITLFARDIDIGGVPLIVVYVFATWLALIACAALLARRLPGSPRDAGREDEPHP